MVVYVDSSSTNVFYLLLLVTVYTATSLLNLYLYLNIIFDCLGSVMLSLLASGGLWGQLPVKPKTITLVFAASPLSSQL
jgi:hypothetical protein